jgi:hypothetical protein
MSVEDHNQKEVGLTPNLKSDEEFMASSDEESPPLRPPKNSLATMDPELDRTRHENWIEPGLTWEPEPGSPPVHVRRTLAPTTLMFPKFCSTLSFLDELDPAPSEARKYGFKSWNDLQKTTLYRKAPMSLRKYVMERWRSKLTELLTLAIKRGFAGHPAGWDDLMNLDALLVVPRLHHLCYTAWRYHLLEANAEAEFLVSRVVDRNYMYDRLHEIRSSAGGFSGWTDPASNAMFRASGGDGAGHKVHFSRPDAWREERPCRFAAKKPVAPPRQAMKASLNSGAEHSDTADSSGESSDCSPSLNATDKPVHTHTEPDSSAQPRQYHCAFIESILPRAKGRVLADNKMHRGSQLLTTPSESQNVDGSGVVNEDTY